jgi:hypothetical protein
MRLIKRTISYPDDLYQWELWDDKFEKLIAIIYDPSYLGELKEKLGIQVKKDKS